MFDPRALRHHAALDAEVLQGFQAGQIIEIALGKRQVVALPLLGVSDASHMYVQISQCRSSKLIGDVLQDGRKVCIPLQVPVVAGMDVGEVETQLAGAYLFAKSDQFLDRAELRPLAGGLQPIADARVRQLCQIVPDGGITFFP